jgi:hypothetical protein
MFATSTTSINETERCLRSKGHNRADWRSTLRYARVTQCTPNCDINRLRTPPNQIGTAFGTARLIWLTGSTCDTRPNSDFVISGIAAVDTDRELNDFAKN